MVIVLRLIHLTWKEIGFDFKRLYIPILLGLGLGVVCFIIGYGVEYATLSAQGANPSFSFFLSSFSVTGDNTTLPAYYIILFCILLSWDFGNVPKLKGIPFETANYDFAKNLDGLIPQQNRVSWHSYYSTIGGLFVIVLFIICR